jgi:tetratricopeptide (TPR) repeat protein
MTTLHDILEKARASGQKLQPSEATVVFAAAVRLAASRSATLRPRLLQIDEAGGLHLDPFDERALETEPAYMAPELFGPGAQRKNEPRVQVFAAGALGHELITGMPVPQRGPGSELSGPLGDIVRIALSRDRRERFGDLTQLQDALGEVHERPPAEGERNILLAVRNRFGKPAPGKEALTRITEKVAALENQLGKVAAFEQHLIKIDARVQSLAESLEHFEEGQRRMQPRKQSSGVASGFFAGLLGAALALGGAWAAGLLAPVKRAAPPAPAATAVDDAGQGAQAAAERPPPAEPPPAAEKPAPPASAPAPTPTQTPASTSTDKPPAADEEKPPPAPAPKAEAEKPAPPEADQSTDAATPQPTPAVVVESADAGAAAPAEPPRGPAAAPARAAKRATVSPSAMNHALALSQVRRGENALEHGRADDALASFKSALDSEPNIAIAWRGMGMALAVQGKDAQALKAYEKYLQLSPSATDAADIRKSMAELKERGKLGESK